MEWSGTIFEDWEYKTALTVVQTASNQAILNIKAVLVGQALTDAVTK
jgi:hypothetical protein